MKRLLLLSYRFPPETYPLALGLRGVVDGLRKEWTIDVVTAASNAYAPENVTVHTVAPRSFGDIYGVLHTLKLRRLAELGTWPDPFLPWVVPACMTAHRIAQDTPPDAIMTFMMPYSTGFAGVLLKKLTGAPLLVNLDDSPTCTDQNPTFPSRLHYEATRWMEDFYVRSADAVAYVSQNNLERVRERQSPIHRSKLHLIRYGATSPPSSSEAPRSLLPCETFNIVYVGGMSGWGDFVNDEIPALKQMYRRMSSVMQYRLSTVDHRPHGPVYIGQAVRRLFDSHPSWSGRVALHFFGPSYSHDPIDRVLQESGIADIVLIHSPVDHETSRSLQREADCLFMSLPARSDGTGSSIISSKTYEYLQTDRPILAALPPGENWNYLDGRAGVHLTPPSDPDAMAAALEPLVDTWLSGGTRALAVDRSHLRDDLSSDTRAAAFNSLLHTLTEKPAPHAFDSPPTDAPSGPSSVGGSSSSRSKEPARHASADQPSEAEESVEVSTHS